MANSELSIKVMRSGKDEEEGKKTLAAAAAAVFWHVPLALAAL